MLVPILSLMGVKNGVISTMRERLLEDPMILIITPKSDAGKYDAEFIRNLSNLPGAAFAIGRTRETTTDVTFVNERSGTVSIGLEPAAKGEPVLAHFSIMAPEDGKQPQIVLSASAAKNWLFKKTASLQPDWVDAPLRESLNPKKSIFWYQEFCLAKPGTG